MKGENPDAVTQRMIQGITNAKHREATLRYNRVRRVCDGTAPRTLMNDTQALLTLATYLDKHARGVAFMDATREDTLGWRAALTPEFGLMESTATQYAIHVKRAYKFFADPDEYQNGKKAQRLMPYPKQVTILGATSRKRRRLPVDSLVNEDDVRAMIAVCSTPRDQTVVALYWDTGGRLAEGTEIKVRNYEADRRGASSSCPRTAMTSRPGCGASESWRPRRSSTLC